jgi:hypothetical protein
MHLGSADVQRVLSEGSYEIARGIVSEIIQRPIMPNYSPSPAISAPAAPRIVEADTKYSPRSEGNKAVVAPEPTHKEVRKQPKPFLAAPGQQIRPAKKLPKMRRLHRLESHSHARKAVVLASQAVKTTMK